MTRKEEITKKIEQLEVDLCSVDKDYEYYVNQHEYYENKVTIYSEMKMKLNKQIYGLKEELQEIESENLIAPLNSAITSLKNYCETRKECDNCLLSKTCKKEPCWWSKI